MIHQYWQRLNLIFAGFFLGQVIRLPDQFTLWLALAWVLLIASAILEVRFNKRDVSGWRTGQGLDQWMR